MLNCICSNVYLVHIVFAYDYARVSLEVEDAVCVEVVLDLIASMIYLIEFDEVAFVVSVDS